MHCRGLGSLRGQSVTRHPTACHCHRGHRFLLAASGITPASCNPLLTTAARSALERSTLPKSNHFQIRNKSLLRKGTSSPQSPSLFLLHLFPVEVRDVRNDGMKVWLPQATGLQGWEFHCVQGIWGWTGGALRGFIISVLPQWEKCLLQKLLLQFQLHFSPFIYTISMRCSLES